MALINICERCGKPFQTHNAKDKYCPICTLKVIDGESRLLEIYKKRKEGGDLGEIGS